MKWRALALVSACFVAIIATSTFPVHAAERCELHVWPSAGLTMMRAHARNNFNYGYGPAIGGGIGGLLDQEKANRVQGVIDDFTYEERPADRVEMLRPVRQGELLQSIPLADKLNLTGYSIVMHDQPATITMARNPAPLVENPASCHAELLLASLTYARVYAHGHRLKSLVILREFGPAHVLQRRAAIPVEAPLTTSTKEDERTPAAFTEDLERAFLDTIGLFAQARTKAQAKAG